MSVNQSQSLSTIRQIKSWFESAVPKPNAKNIHAQLGVHMEEVGEMLETLRDAGSTFPVREQLGLCVDVVDFTQRQLKAYTGGAEIALQDLDRTALLDSLADQIVTSVGVAHMLGMDIEGALNEVACSNDSKFGANGKPIFNDQMKIMKGPGYYPPDLAKFTGRI